MKKKNVLMMALSLALVAVIAVGGTLALLTAQDGTLTNQFTFAGNIKVDLWENAVGEVNSTSGLGRGTTGSASFNYGEILVNKDYTKDVNVTVETKNDAWVFIRVSAVGNEGEPKMTLGDFASVWTKQVGGAADGYAIYATKVNGNDQPTTLDVFNQVRLVASSGTVVGATGIEIQDIEIDVYAIQASNGTSAMTADQAYEAAQGEGLDWGDATFTVE